MVVVRVGGGGGGESVVLLFANSDSRATYVESAENASLSIPVTLLQREYLMFPREQQGQLVQQRAVAFSGKKGARGSIGCVMLR